MTQIGCGTGYSVKVEGDFLYISGELEKATSVTTTPAPTGGQGACALTGKYGGYLAKISKADGKCVWAKDTPKHHRAVSDGTSVWAASEGEAPLIYDASHSVAPNSAERDIFVAKYSAVDGTGHWAAAVGGIGEEGLSDLAMTSNGPMIMGSSDSPSFTMGSVEIHNLQHDFLGKKETEGAGHNGMFAVVLSPTDVNPSCIANEARSPKRGCFKCEASKSQSLLRAQSPALVRPTATSRAPARPRARRRRPMHATAVTACARPATQTKPPTGGVSSLASSTTATPLLSATREPTATACTLAAALMAASSSLTCRRPPPRWPASLRRTSTPL